MKDFNLFMYILVCCVLSIFYSLEWKILKFFFWNKLIDWWGYDYVFFNYGCLKVYVNDILKLMIYFCLKNFFYEFYVLFFYIYCVMIWFICCVCVSWVINCNVMYVDIE